MGSRLATIKARFAKLTSTKSLLQINKADKTITVVAYKNTKVLSFGGDLYQSYERHDGKLEPLIWSYFLFAPYFYTGSSVNNACLLGLGGGVVAKLYSHYFPDIVMTGVEIDSDVAKIARVHFELPQDTRVVIDDAAHYTATTFEPFDLMLVDLADKNGTIPLVWQPKFLHDLRSRLSQNGVLVINYLGADDHLQSLLATLKQLFTTIFHAPITITEQKNQMLYATINPITIEKVSEAIKGHPQPAIRELAKPFLDTIKQVH